MKKFILSLAALAAVSSVALAERSYDLDSSPESRGTFSSPADALVDGTSIGSNTLATSENEGRVIYYGKYGSTTDALEARRWSEKN
jgi:hypothetical protein